MTPPPNIRIVTDGDARVQGSGEHDFGGSWGPLPSSGHLRTRGKCWTCSSGRAGNTDLPLDREALVTAPTGHGVASNLASITPARLWTRYNSREVVSIALVETKCMRHSLFRYPPYSRVEFFVEPSLGDHSRCRDALSLFSNSLSQPSNRMRTCPDFTDGEGKGFARVTVSSSSSSRHRSACFAQ